MTVTAVPPKDPNEFWMTERSEIFARPDEPLTQDRVLRRLEALRQRLSIRWCGTTGAFTGFDSLQVDQGAAIVSGTVMLTASMVSTLEKSDVVELTATWVDDRDGDAPEPQQIVAGTGRALELNS